MLAGRGWQVAGATGSFRWLSAAHTTQKWRILHSFLLNLHLAPLAIALLATLAILAVLALLAIGVCTTLYVAAKPAAPIRAEQVPNTRVMLTRDLVLQALLQTLVPRVKSAQMQRSPLQLTEWTTVSASQLSLLILLSG